MSSDHPPRTRILAGVVLIVTIPVVALVVARTGVEVGSLIGTSDPAPVAADEVATSTSEDRRSTATSTTAASTASTTVASTTSTTATPTTSTTAAPPPPEPAVLRRSSEGPAVAALQERLRALGYRPGAADGHYGAQTVSAVLAFQKVEGLQRDGLAGPQVMAAVEQPAGIQPRSAAGNHLEVDLSRQVVLAVIDGQTTILNASSGNEEIYTTPSGGRARAVTPTGSFAVERRIDGMREAPLGDLWRPLYFNGGIAVHGSGSVPAYPASHGCVRVSFEDQDWLFPQIPTGTPVEVYE